MAAAGVAGALAPVGIVDGTAARSRGPPGARCGIGAITEIGRAPASRTVSSGSPGMYTTARTPPYGDGSTCTPNPYCRTNWPAAAKPDRGGSPSCVSSRLSPPASSSIACLISSACMPTP
ncbi:hypothetical protein AOB60_17290 [Streptomyces noursei]|uniref:Uncharacterized protein n=1 Tax=Streptomyces noursei TaxID=1971 RepID=A0A2N8PMM4_STRNR|nr:hypothetical protein AOB60_17290 [Streptomyces noursei]